MSVLQHRVHRQLELPESAEQLTDLMVGREWLVTNGLGGYASGTLAGVPTRRYHGLLVAALPNPCGRTVMLSEISERVRLADGTSVLLSGEERSGDPLALPAARALASFELDDGLPVWRFHVGSAILEKRVWMPHGQNTTCIRYRLLEEYDGHVRLNLRPALNFRALEAPVSTPLRDGYSLRAKDGLIEVHADGPAGLPPLRCHADAAHHGFTFQPVRMTERLFRSERHRGYDDVGDLWSPGYFRMDLPPGGDATLTVSTESESTALALSPAAGLDAERERRQHLVSMAPASSRTGVAAELVLAADAFIVSPAYRATDVARSRAAGDDVRSVIAGYHWCTDSGRDTMIALEGLTLCTGRHEEAGQILRTFARYVRDGLIPNMFPDGSSDGLYHTADASLWFFHAVDRYVTTTGDRNTLRRVLPALVAIADAHVRGTRFGIRVDEADGLLTQGEEGVQLTWMDAKVDDWVVTPRRGKAVELNALWYNALRLLAGWTEQEQERDPAPLDWATHARRTHASFNQRFWYDAGQHLYDVVDGPDGDDAALRPNQLMAIGLRHPVLDPSRWEPVLTACREHLLTPVGLRSLAPGHPEYRANYHGDLRQRDGAYHQGTVWPWLIGPFVDAWLRTYPDDRRTARSFLGGLVDHLDDFGVGSVAEIFDAEPPYTARGCIAQAWSVAELLRCLLRTEME